MGKTFPAGGDLQLKQYFYDYLTSLGYFCKMVMLQLNCPLKRRNEKSIFSAYFREGK